MLAALNAAGYQGPSPTEELGWWVDQLIMECEVVLDCIDTLSSEPDPRESARLKKELRERLWALGCLFLDPPDGNRETVRRRLRRRASMMW